MNHSITTPRTLLGALALLLVSAQASAGEDVTIVHTDHLGSPVYYTDVNGALLTKVDYTPYGEDIADTTDEEVSYTGHVLDRDTDLIYAQARYYDPVIGRFLSTDPVRFSPGKPRQFNRYQYANSNPYAYVDPDGQYGVFVKAIKLIAKGGDAAATFAGAIEDANTLMDSSASAGDRAFAAVSLASEIFSPVSLRDGKALAGAVGAVGKKTCCFVAGTQVLTRDGYKNIEDVKLGEELWAKNTETGEQAWKPVTKVFVEPGRGIFEIVLNGSDGVEQKIEATDDHPFWVVGKGWKTTVELELGDRIETDGDEPMSVVSVTDEKRSDVTYNFTVADFHTYYVTERNVLVHNCPSSGGGRKAGADNAPKSTLPRAENGDYKPHPDAEGSHSTIGTRTGSDGKEYRQGATFDEDGNFQGRTDVTDHGRPQDHSSPHFHEATGPNSVSRENVPVE